MQQTKQKRQAAKTLWLALLLGLLAMAAPFLCLLLPRQATPATGSSAVRATPAPAMAEDSTGLGGQQTAPVSTAPAATSAPRSTAGPSANATVPLYDNAAGQEIAVPLTDFLVGAAACEMPPTWPDAALQAQMVASHSYALAQGSSPMSVNSAHCAGWTNAEVLKARWGDDFDKYYTHLQALAEPVATALLTYDGEPAAACYHGTSAGHTEASQNVWLTALPYLQGVDSKWDSAAPDFELSITYTAAQMLPLLQGLGLSPDENAPESWFGDARWSDTGYVEEIEVCGEQISGTAIRAALSLRSACFTIQYADAPAKHTETDKTGAGDGDDEEEKPDKNAESKSGGTPTFTITTRGYGHGVGLSQYGAKSMAAGGANWQDILLYYFPGCTITQN